MIVFPINYPVDSADRDGMMKRVLAIDSLLDLHDRIYLDISFSRNIKANMENINDNVKVYHVNFFMHFIFIFSVIRKCRLIYAHSVYSLLAVFPFVGFTKLVLDIHGVVPEECTMMNCRFKSYMYGWLERNAVKKATLLVHVSENMLKYFELKYKLKLSGRSLVLPIFDPLDSEGKIKSKPPGVVVVYAGGDQVWQNVRIMMETVRRCHAEGNKFGISFKFFFPLSSVKRIRESYADVFDLPEVSIGSASKREVVSQLASAHYGFILRDDSVVNNVACPTKVVEYISLGVVPVVISENIGDFSLMGYSFIFLDSLFSGVLSKSYWDVCVANNNLIYQLFLLKVKGSAKDLKRQVQFLDS